MTVRQLIGRLAVRLGAPALPACAAAESEPASAPVVFEAPAGRPVARHGALPVAIAAQGGDSAHQRFDCELAEASRVTDAAASPATRSSHRAMIALPTREHRDHCR